MKTTRWSIYAVTTWVRRQPPKMKAFLALILCLTTLLFIRMVVRNYLHLFLASEAVHALGVSILIFKLITHKTCSGLSLKSQELTAMFTSVRVYCSFDLGYHRHTILHLTTLVTTLWVIYMIRFKLKSTYMNNKDNLPIYYVVVPCAVLSLFIHPTLIRGHSINSILWAFCIYLESVSVLPQLRLMQKAKIVEPFAAHYVFALGVERFLSSAIWILEVINSYGRLLTGFSNGISWPVVVILCEIVQTFILVDFCYYYLKSIVGGQPVLRLPPGVV